MLKKCSVIATAGLLIFYVSSSIAQVHKGISFQGVIKSPTGEKPTHSGLTVQGLIFSPNNCILRAEEFSNVSINNGYINLVIGKGSPIAGQDPGLSFEKVMDNSEVIPSLTCYDSNGNITTSTYDPAVGDGRRKFRLILTLDSAQVVADFNIRAVAYAVSAQTADEAKKLNGKLASEFIQTTPSVTQQKVQDWFSSSMMTSILSNNYKPSAAVSADTLSETLPISKGGTNSSATLNNNRIMVSSGGAIIEAPALTASRALVSDANGIPIGTSVTNTELGYLSGVT